MPPPTLLFLHIPKAAGTTFEHIIRRQARREACLWLAPETHAAQLAAYRQLAPEQRLAFRLIGGHMPFGLHTSVPGPATYVTFLRDPIERVISYYYFVLESPNHYLYQRISQHGVSLRGFVAQRLSTELDNGQTRMLAAHSAQRLPHGFGELTPDLVDVAQRHLDQHFVVAGLAEHFNATLLLLRARLGWPYYSLLYSYRNRTASRPPISAIAPEVIRVIRQHHQFDLALYDYVRQRLQRELEKYVPRTAQAVARFERWNSAYAQSYDVYRRLRRAVPPALKRQAARWRAARRGPALESAREP